MCRIAFQEQRFRTFSVPVAVQFGKTFHNFSANRIFSAQNERFNVFSFQQNLLRNSYFPYGRIFVLRVHLPRCYESPIAKARIVFLGYLRDRLDIGFSYSAVFIFTKWNPSLRVSGFPHSAGAFKSLNWNSTVFSPWRIKSFEIRNLLFHFFPN